MKTWFQKLPQMGLVLCLAWMLFPVSAMAGEYSPHGVLLATEETEKYDAYYELYDATGTTKLTNDADNDGKLDVKAGESYVAKVFVKPNADQKLRGFELNLTYDSANMTVADDTSFNAVNHDDVAVANGTVQYVLYQAGNATAAYYPMTANTGLQVAQFTFTLKDAVAADTTMTFGFGDKNEVAVDGVVDAISVAPTSASVDILPEVAVTWYANGGKIGGAESTATKVTYGQAAVAPGEPAKGGYTFVGWYDSADNDQTVITEFPALYAAAEYAAKWTATTYTITPDLDGGTLPDGSSMTDYTIENGELPIPTRPGCIFDSWKATSVEGDSNLTVGETVTSLTGKYGNVTLTAQWKLIEGALAIKSATISGNTGTVEAVLPDLKQAANMVTAFYDAAGRMIGVDLQVVDSTMTSKNTLVTLSRSPSSVRVFLLSIGDYIPLTPYAAYSFSNR